MAGSSLGFRHGPKTKQKISEAHKGKELTPETKQKISEAFSGDKNVNIGKFLTPETRSLQSEAHKGKIICPKLVLE
jgi:NUMOD3 motif